MAKDLVNLSELNEIEDAFSIALKGLAENPEISTEKGSDFDILINGLLKKAFVYHAIRNGAHFIPIERTDFRKFRENSKEAEDFFRAHNGTDIHSIALAPRNDLYAVPLGQTYDKNQNVPYARESKALNDAYHSAQEKVREVISASSVAQEKKDHLISILDKKTESGRRFLGDYLDIIAPNSQTPLSSYRTLGELVREVIEPTPTILSESTTEESIRMAQGLLELTGRGF